MPPAERGQLAALLGQVVRVMTATERRPRMFFDENGSKRRPSRNV
jgi:hypothetical protein